jgi:hypothetical protein
MNTALNSKLEYFSNEVLPFEIGNYASRNVVHALDIFANQVLPYSIKKGGISSVTEVFLKVTSETVVEASVISVTEVN